MDVTRRTDYACRILRGAYESGSEYVSVTTIADREGIPYAFARSIQHDLVKAGLIKTIRGSRGGLTLACDPKEATLLEVLEAVQGQVSVAPCSSDPYFCDKQPNCAFNCVWQAADKVLHDFFTQFTLHDILTLGKKHPAVMEILGESGIYERGACATRESRKTDLPVAN